MSIIQFFDDMEVKDFLLLSSAFLILIVTGFVVGFVGEPEYRWMIYVAAVISGLFVVFASMYIVINRKEWKKETELIAELPSFPEPDFCDVCSEKLEGGERRTDGEFLVIICPHCNAENIVSSEKKIQAVEKTIEEEESE